MEDARIWAFEESLWTGDAENYRAKISDDVVMALPQPPYSFDSASAVEAVSNTPRWERAEFSHTRVHRPQHGLIVLAYHVKASREGSEDYNAHCTTTMHLEGEHEWKVVQHQQHPMGPM